MTNTHLLAPGLALALLLSPSPCQKTVPAVGEMAPELGLTSIVSPAGVVPPKWSDLRGKVVVVEFWATWCGSCVAHLPETNALVDRFADRDLRYIAVTAEKEDRVARFLKRRPRKGWVALDGDGAAFTTFDPVAVPHVVIVDREGRIAASTWADKVTPEVIERALAGKPLDLPVKRTKRTIDYAAIRAMQPPAGAEISVEPGATEISRMTIRRDWQLVIGGATRDFALRMVYDLPKTQYRVELPKDERLWSINAAVPVARSAELMPLLKNALQERMGFDVVEEQASMKVLVLERIPDAAAPSPSQAEKAKLEMRGTFLKATKKPMRALARHLRRLAGDIPCIDETGLAGLYDFEIEALDKESLQAELAALGLRYRKEERSMPLHVFRPKPAER